jgi:hypothetical protein
VKNEDVEKCIRLVSEKSHICCHKRFGLGALAALLSILHLEDESNKDEGMKLKFFWMTHKTKSFLMTQNTSQSLRQNLTLNPNQSSSLNKERKIPNQENPVGSQNDGG